MSEIYRLLKPGGYVELIELDCDFQRWGPWGQRGIECCKHYYSYCWHFKSWIFHFILFFCFLPVCSYIRSRDIDPTFGRHMHMLMSRAQLTPLHLSYVSMPLGRWGGKLGMLFAEDMLAATLALKPLIVDEHGSMSIDDFKKFREAVPDEWEQYQSFANYFTCFGRKEK